MERHEHDTSDDGGTMLWSLTWQSAVARQFFVDASLYDRIRDHLVTVHGRQGRVLINYLLLPAEIHALSKLTPGDSIRSVARDIGSMVARWVRDLEPIRSPVMAGPYRSLQIASPEDLRIEIRMLAWRPVFLKLCATPTHYAHGGLRVALGMTRVQGFDPGALLSLFGERLPGSRDELRRWVSRRPEAPELRAWELTHGLAQAESTLGTSSSLVGIARTGAAALVAATDSNTVEAALALLERWVIAKLALGSAEMLRAASSRGARGRAMVALIAIEHSLCSATFVARYFGRSRSTLSEQMKAARARPADLRMVSTSMDRILDDLAALSEQAHGVHGVLRGTLRGTR